MIKVFDDNLEFLKTYEDYLNQDEIKNNLIIGIAQNQMKEGYHFVSSRIEERILIGVLAGKNLILASNTLEMDVYNEMVEHMANIDYPGIIGEKEASLTYQRAYKNFHGKDMIVEMNQRIYFCKKVLTDTKVEGTFRLATIDDYEILKYWANEFVSEVEGYSVTFEESNKTLDRLLASKGLYVLENDGHLLSMAARSRPWKHTETISYVFTPKSLRRKGYATKVVEILTNIILKDKDQVTLYTDLANPTSNSIYQKIGFVPYCDSIVLNIQ
jgi:ribosomal protein S18 acetylase RimI-like enzyme